MGGWIWVLVSRSPRVWLESGREVFYTEEPNWRRFLQGLAPVQLEGTDAMRTRYLTWTLHGSLTLLALASMAWASFHAWSTSADLMRRAEESALFVDREDPYQLPGMTYPPSALVVFAPLVAPFPPQGLRAVWLVMNLAALGDFVCWCCGFGVGTGQPGSRWRSV